MIRTDETGVEIAADPDRVLVCNPVSGTGDHAPEIRLRGLEHGFEVVETTAAGDARRLARQAAERGASLVAVAGGDGTVNEAVHGLVDADALETTDVAVIPTGTANLFAKRLGLWDIDRSFEILDRGHRRRIDVGFADERPFLNTCLAGLSAEANTATSDELKRRLGALAYVVTTIRLLPTYEGVPLRVTTDGESPTDASGSETWLGNALLVLVGNAFRLPSISRRDESAFTDGQLEVTAIRERPSLEGIERGTLPGIFTDSTPRETTSVSIDTLADDPVSFSLDGELFSSAGLEIGVRERCLSLFVDPADDTTRE
ncbi:diacylglycerol kinase family protein [Natronolimnohabitans sp. A-GB9]|uniref:diacylglycerol/lipid kinase family protein n=1 Tax=Natronolimnohabitans sp. A-GB9 TaxID=3069757 RepID=UPI0027B565CE|nr:diacylglycerol kinase family protein [Natronolimnohabitans sp. A-GB9]MDQ2052414.1 diacylglycerol kinase family protein [Natronolimnohabitans sp. A-GB9]